MPNFAHLPALVETATKCFATASSPRAPVSQARALTALVMVSWVVKVFEATMNSVRSGRAAQRVGEVRAVDVGDEVRRAGPALIGLQRLADHDRAEVGAADADVDDIGDGLPGGPRQAPLRTGSEKPRIRSSTAATRA